MLHNLSVALAVLKPTLHQVGLDLTELRPPPAPECWDERPVLPHLLAFTALAEDEDSVFSTHLAAHSYCNSSSRGSGAATCVVYISKYTPAVVMWSFCVAVKINHLTLGSV